MRAREHYPYIDTVLVGPNASNVDGWYDTFADMAKATELNFFNMRNEATAGAMYCNQDNEGDLDVGYLIESIGIEVLMPPISGKYFPVPQSTIEPIAIQYARFVEMINMLSFAFYIGQDEVVNGPVTIFPQGYGASGTTVSGIHNAEEIDLEQSTTEMYANGWPDFQNRWQFAKPKEVPRNRNIKGIITIPEIVRATLEDMQGPGHVQVAQAGGISGPGWLPARLGFRVTLNGTRIVQLRNASTYY
jgi:hypothetical protein